MKQLSSLVLCAALLLSLSACDGPGDVSSGLDSSQVGDVTVPEESIPFSLPVFLDFSLHPVLGANRANLTLSPLLYEGLFLVDESFQAVPVLCESWSVSEDLLTWTFTLRPGITFSNGAELTAQIAADALELARGKSSRYATRLADVADVAASEEDPLTFTVTLTRPNSSLPLLLDIPLALGEGDRPLGTGPYVLSGGEDGLTLIHRTDWWQGIALPLEEIALYEVSRSDELIYAFDAGNISLLDVDLMATNALGYGGNYQTWDYATTDLLYLGFNTRSGPCRDPQVRQAISRAVDRTPLVQTTYASHAAASPLPVHPDSPLYNQAAADRLSYAPEELAGHLEQFGLEEVSLTLLVNSENDAKVSAAGLIAYQLESAGLTVQVEQLPFEDFTAALAARDFDLYLGETVLTADFDLSHLLSSIGNLNYGGWEASSADALLSALRTASETERPQAAADFFAYLEQEAPIAPLLFKNGSVLTQWGRASGLNPIRNNVFYQLENWTVTKPARGRPGTKKQGGIDP